MGVVRSSLRPGAILVLLAAVAAGCGEKDDSPAAGGTAPTIVSFTASPQSVEPGQASRLTWETTGAGAVVIAPEGQDPIDLGGAAASAGSVDVRPDATTRYVLTASGDEGKTTTATTLVEVQGGLPTITFQAKDGRIDYGGSTELTWTTTGATAVRISDGDEVIHQEGEPIGALTVSPSRTTSYRLVATGPGGEREQTVTVEVAPVLYVFTADVTDPVHVGTSVTLRWETSGAEAVTVSNVEGFVHDAPAAELDRGEVSAPVGASGRFLLTILRGSIEVSSEAVVHLDSTPVVLSFSADPPAVTITGTVVLSWRTAGAISSSIEAIPGGYLVLQHQEDEGTVEAWVAEDTRFVLTATGPRGEIATSELEVAALPEPTIGSFAASPGRVGRGEEFLLSWTTTGASRVELEIGGQPLPTPLEVSGSTSVSIDSDSTIVLKAFNDAGAKAESSLAVTTGAPSILDFECEEEEAQPGNALLFTWANLGGVSAEVLGPDGPMLDCSIAGASDVALGGCTTFAPTMDGEVEFTLVVANALGEESTRSLTVLLRDGVIISRFVASPTRITEGDDFELSWVVGPDAYGNPPILALEDELGNEYPLGEPAPSSLVITPAGIGTRTFTLTASTDSTSPTSATARVEIFEAPAVSLSASSPTYDPASGVPVTLTWSASGASTLSIFALDGSGAPVMPPVHVATPQELASGSRDVRPVGPTTYRAVATNAAGATVSDDVLVDAPSFQIVSFSATPDVISPGESVTLEWQTVGADAVDLDIPQGFGVSPATEPFMDISTSPTRQESMPHNCVTQFDDEGCATVDFPDGFTFPFDGVLHDRAKLFHNGFIGFDLGFTGINYTNFAIPNPSRTYANLAAFWDDIKPTTNDILYDTGWDARGQYMVVQWTHFSGAYQVDDMNFQIVMWDDGSFDYRYATMTSQVGTSKALGESATIGYQNLAGTSGHLVSFDTIVPTLENSGYSFGQPQLLPTGSTIVQPTTTRTYTLTAHGPGGIQVSETITVTVSP